MNSLIKSNDSATLSDFVITKSFSAEFVVATDLLLCIVDDDEDYDDEDDGDYDDEDDGKDGDQHNDRSHMGQLEMILIYFIHAWILLLSTRLLILSSCVKLRQE